MLGAPPGFIPTRNGDIVNVHSIDSVCSIDTIGDAVQASIIKNSWRNYIRDPGLDFSKPVICVESRGVKWFFNMSVQQFAARMVEAMRELSQPF